jgi:hypothetical protein
MLRAHIGGDFPPLPLEAGTFGLQSVAVQYQLLWGW